MCDAFCHTGCVPGNVYNPDHTAFVRELIKRLRNLGLTGLALTAMSAVALAVIMQIGTPAPTGLTRTVWMGVCFVGALSMVTLAAAGWWGVLYSWRRADLDARGAEAVGEFKARLVNEYDRHDTDSSP